MVVTISSLPAAPMTSKASRSAVMCFSLLQSRSLPPSLWWVLSRSSFTFPVTAPTLISRSRYRHYSVLCLFHTYICQLISMSIRSRMFTQVVHLCSSRTPSFECAGATRSAISPWCNLVLSIRSISLFGRRRRSLIVAIASALPFLVPTILALVRISTMVLEEVYVILTSVLWPSCICRSSRPWGRSEASCKQQYSPWKRVSFQDFTSRGRYVTNPSQRACLISWFESSLRLRLPQYWFAWVSLVSIRVSYI